MAIEDEVDKFVTISIILRKKVDKFGIPYCPYLMDSKTDDIGNLIFPTPSMV